MMKKDRLQVRVDSEVKSDVQQFARENGTTVSALVNTFLNDLARQVRKRRRQLRDIQTHDV